MRQADDVTEPLPSTRDLEGRAGPGKPQGSLWKRQIREGSVLLPHSL